MVLNKNVQNCHHETENAVHVLGECLLDVSAPLCWQRLESDYILGQPQKDQHDQLGLCLLLKKHKCVNFSLV